MKYIFSFFTFLFLSVAVFSQKIDNVVSYRSMNSDRYFRIHYDNDYFSATDENYTQGYSLELVAPGLANNPLNFMLLKPAGSQLQFGLAIEHIGYTPPNIKSPLIQFGDRPFAAAIMLKSFVMATDTGNRSKFSTSFSAGLIGQGAFGKEMQVGIHKLTGNVIPEGWQNQIRNDVVLNYEVTYEKQLLRYNNFLSLQGGSSLRAGTLFTGASVSMNSAIGIINSPFDINGNRNFQLFFYAEPVATLVGYDATLQGGIFNNTSPYTIAAEEIERLTGQFNYGIVLKTKTLYFEYTRTAITREFESGSSAKWGGIRIGFTY